MFNAKRDTRNDNGSYGRYTLLVALFENDLGFDSQKGL